MGSEHYCLRWNNHQSNLLGVFSQLLQDESLVDVTLSCSEGTPIRAHKVVLSACSSYFQSLFLDHPEKHPIVILKDVRFAELQTLVEFMYKGEVNVQYCQLSALLKTAESLKVKGLAEMTNQNTTLREPEREPERLRPHSQPCKSNNSSCDSPVDATLSGPSTSTATSASNIVASSSAASTAAAVAAAAASVSAAPSIATAVATSTSTNAATSTSATTNAAAAVAAAATSTQAAPNAAGVASSKRSSSSTAGGNESSAAERCSPSPPKRIQVKSMASTHQQQQQQQHQQDQDSPLPLDLYQRRLDQHQTQQQQQQQQHQHQHQHQHQQHHEDTKENSIVNNNASSVTNDKSQRSPTPHCASSESIKHQNNNDGSAADVIMKREEIERDSGREMGESSYHSPERLSDVHRSLGRDCDDAMTEKIDDVEDVDYGDEEMDLDDDGDNSSDDVGLNMKIRSSSLAAALVSPNLRIGLETGFAGIGSLVGRGGGHDDGDSARSTPLISTAPLALDHSTQRPLSRSSREGGSGLDRPSSRGGLGCLPSTSATSMAGGLSPASASAAALGLVSESLAGPSGLGPVQSVPLSLKKEIDCSEDDNSNSRHLQPRSASASGILGGELDYRTSHESETSESPHGILNAGGCSGSGSSSAGGAVVGGLCPSSSSAANTASSYVHDQPRTPPPYTCVYCGAGFPTQSKLTRHILSHSLKTLEYRETATHALLNPHLLAHDLNMSPLAYQMNAAMAATAGGDPQEHAAAMAAAVAMDMDFAAAIAAAGGCAFPALTGCTARGLDLDGSGGGGGSSSSGRGRDRGGRGGGLDDDGRISSGNGGCPGSSLSLLSGAGSSTSAAAAAAAAAASSSASSLLGSSAMSSNDPNSVVLCKFCGKSFPDVTSLIQHLPVHTGDRPFKCEFCGKAFKLRHHMKDHCRVHTGERPFRCQMCGKTFSRSTILKAHEKTHFPKYARKYLTPSPVDTKDELPQ